MKAFGRSNGGNKVDSNTVHGDYIEGDKVLGDKHQHFHFDVQPAPAALKVSISRLPKTGADIFVGRENSLRQLDEAWEKKETRIATLEAEGGAG